MPNALQAAAGCNPGAPHFRTQPKQFGFPTLTEVIQIDSDTLRIRVWEVELDSAVLRTRQIPEYHE